MREECCRQIEEAGGNVKAAAINLGYASKPESFYMTLRCLGVRLERRSKAVLNSDAKPHKNVK